MKKSPDWAALLLLKSILDVTQYACYKKLHAVVSRILITLFTDKNITLFWYQTNFVSDVDIFGSQGRRKPQFSTPFKQPGVGIHYKYFIDLEPEPPWAVRLQEDKFYYYGIIEFQ